MDKAIDKGNLIDFFAVLLPGMVGVILSVVTNLPLPIINAGEDVMSDITSSIMVLLIFLLSSYIAGLLLMEMAVIFQKVFPSFFDYYKEAIKKDALKEEGTVLFEFLVFQVPFSSSKENTPRHLKVVEDLINKAKTTYENKEFWLLTHNFSDLVERKKAYSMMNRSMAMIPFAYMIVQAYIVYVVKIGSWPVCWKMILIISVGVILYHRARRQAFLIYHEVNKIYDCADKNA